MVADVPVGAFLSGGIDSSLVVALMAASSSIPVRTFSIGFAESKYNEAEHAKAVADHLGCVHTEFYVTPAEARGVIPKLPQIFDEPFADPSMIPTLLVSKLTRQSVTVALSGDGGDELFGGYKAYTACEPGFTRNRRWPFFLRRIAAESIRKIPADTLDMAFGVAGVSNAASRLQRVASVLAHDEPGRTYQAMVSHWDDPRQVVIDGSEPAIAFADPTYSAVAGSDVASMMLLDAAVYLPDDILVKVDRASMAVSLESRCPLLDYRLFEFAWRMPMSLKRKNGIGKWPLKQLAYRLIPRTLLERPKTGFSIPTAEWLRGPLSEWSADLLDSGRLRREGFLDPAPVERAWKFHLTGKADNGSRLWTILMFESWLQQHRTVHDAVQSCCVL
jgi:asparagine synthase (glutamine-hydrolysing)